MAQSSIVDKGYGMGSGEEKPASESGTSDARTSDARASDAGTDSRKRRRRGTRPRGLTYERKLTSPGNDPLEEARYEKRTSVITNTDGSVVFKMEGVEIPSGWSQLATDIVVSKYFRKAGLYGDKSQGETSARHVVHRIAHTIRDAGERFGGYFASTEDADSFEAELAYFLLHQYGAFNSPVWFNCGLWHEYEIKGAGGNFAWNPVTEAGSPEEIYAIDNNYERPQCSACFIQAVNDDLMSIYDLVKSEARLFKYGSGTGTNFSAIRSKHEKLSGGGTSSGLMSFLEVLDRAAGATKSGGTTRRAAKMVCLDMDHPEIIDFIGWKVREERKAKALIGAGYDGDFNGDAYHTVSGQNSNNSVRVTDKFMRTATLAHGGATPPAPSSGKVPSDVWRTTARTTGEVIATHSAAEMWRMIAEAAWECADPGVQYDSTINDWHTCPNSDRIRASNPCSEFMFLDDTACNLSSLNLTKFLREDNSFDVELYRHAVRVFFTAMEILVDLSSYPTRQIAKNSHDYRPLGLGYANLGTLLMRLGMSYDSEEGRALAAAVTAILCGQAYKTSAEMASAKGAFAGYAKNEQPMLRVMAMHREAAYEIDRDKCPEPLWRAAVEDWDAALELGQEHGYRNAQATVLAPTGCLVGGTLVPTERGLVRLQSLGDPDGSKWQELGLRVGTDEGPRTATQFYVNGREHVVTLETARGYTIRGTPTHRIKVVEPESGAWVWKRFAEIEEDDLVPLALNPLVGEPQRVVLPPLPEAYWTGEHHSHAPRRMTPELAELIGYFMGDGSLHSRGIRLCVAAEDHDVVERLVALGKELFNIDAKIAPKKGYTEVAYHSVRVVLWWEACGFAKREPRENHKGKGYLPHVPDAILASNDRAVYGAFLRGLFEADGTAMTAGYPSWSTTSLPFSYDVQQLLLALGLPTTRKMDVTGWGESPLAVLRLLNLGFNEAFLKEVGFVGRRKRDGIRTTDIPQSGRKDHIPVTRALIERLTTSNARLRDVLLTQYRRHHGVSRRSALDLHAQTQDAELGHLLSFFYDRVAFAELGEEELTYDLSVPDNVTYIANGFVSHNTIGLLMDCDTTGVEPDFSLVKFKKLAGGGYFKIVNQSVPAALVTLGYAEHEVQEIVAYICGTNTLLTAPHVNRAKLLQLGLTKEELDKVEAALPSVFDLSQAFATWVIGEDAYTRLGVPAKISLLTHLGFSAQAIQEASDHIVGRMTIEGAPHLKDEHLAVFDCANRCGRLGKRFLAPMSHVHMMAAVQPFICGAISKTINLPNEATIDDVQNVYEEGWRLGLKAVALYRDGCKASQPLSTKDDSKKEDTVAIEAKPVEGKAVEATAGEVKPVLHPTAVRVRLPQKRIGFTQEARVGGHKIFLRTGEYLDGTLGEIFIDMHKEGAAFRSLMNCFSMSVSIGLQYGVPLSTYVDQFTFTRFEPQGAVEGHDNIKFATSIVDYIFRVLGVEYLSRYELAHVQPHLEEATPGTVGVAHIEDPSDTRAQAAPPTTQAARPPAEGASGLDQQLEDMMGDAPVCDACGHITVRNGACYKCLNCGNSLGCS